MVDKRLQLIARGVGAAALDLPHNGLEGRPYPFGPIAFTLRTAPPNALGAFFFGFSEQRLDMTYFGAPGCWFLTSADAVLPMATTAAGSYDIAIRTLNDPNLVGRDAFTQWCMISPGANAFGIILTEGGHIVYGRM